MGTTWVAMIRMPFSRADGESGLSVVGVKTPRSQGSKGEGASLTVLPTPSPRIPQAWLLIMDSTWMWRSPWSSERTERALARAWSSLTDLGRPRPLSSTPPPWPAGWHFDSYYLEEGQRGLQTCPQHLHEAGKVRVCCTWLAQTLRIYAVFLVYEGV